MNIPLSLLRLAPLRAAALRHKQPNLVILRCLSDYKARRAMAMKMYENDERMSGQGSRPDVSLIRSQTSLDVILDPYVPIPKAVLAPIYTLTGIKQRYDAFIKVIRTQLALGQVKKSIRDFDKNKFPQDAYEQYQAMNVALLANNLNPIRDTVTDKVFTALKNAARSSEGNRQWKVTKVVEKPEIVNAIVTAVQEKDNLWFQILVKFHTEQIMAVYSMAGKLLSGDPVIPKPVVEYVLFERHNHPQSRWRICSKLVEPTKLSLDASKTPAATPLPNATIPKAVLPNATNPNAFDGTNQKSIVAETPTKVTNQPIIRLKLNKSKPLVSAAKRA